ncbi:hypothetical protein [Streptomyces sp. NBC_00459]|uniref:hypothetical protein n=1 Tax=Streptomyces sp. NBC_00459 TaxID=2975749 RepID=UPI002E17A3AF
MNPDRPDSLCQAETSTTTWEDVDVDVDVPSALGDHLSVWEDVDVPSAFSDPRPVGWWDCDDVPRVLEILDADATEDS